MDENDLARSIGRVEGKIDLILDRTHGLDARLSAVEKKVWYGSGIAAALAFIVTRLTSGSHA